MPPPLLPGSVVLAFGGHLISNSLACLPLVFGVSDCIPVRFSIHALLHVVSLTIPDPKLGVTVGTPSFFGVRFAAHNLGEIGFTFSIKFRMVSLFFLTRDLKYCTTTGGLRCRKKDSL